MSVIYWQVTQKRTYIHRWTATALLHLKPQHKSGNRHPMKAEGQKQIISTCTLRCAKSPFSTCFSKPHTCTSGTWHSDVTYATFHLISAFFHRGKRINTNAGKHPDFFKQILSCYRGSCKTVNSLIYKIIIKLGFSSFFPVVLFPKYPWSELQLSITACTEG